MSSDQHLFTWPNFRSFLPVATFVIGLCVLMFGGVAIVWSLAGHITQNQNDLLYQGAEINQLVKFQSDQQDLSSSIASQLALLAQSVADMKVIEAHTPN